MISKYDKYFSSGDIGSAKANLMYDIKNHVLYGSELSDLLDDLEKHGLFTNKSFTRQPKNQWDDEYARYLASGFASGYFSREYLFHCAEVAGFLYQKKKRVKMMLFCGVAGLAAFVLIIAFCKA